MINLYVVRHGQTKWNVERRFQGWLDSPLTENGVKCAADLRDQLSHIAFDACYASTSPRAYKTLELILSKNTSDYRTDDRLKEIRLGAWQGMTHSQIEDKYPVELELFYDDPESFNLEEAETFPEVYSRVKSFIDDVVA
ncbi:MAG TPA: histidine phosphatase family protein, partial [Fusibacter sp.]|nr:histidine phosphatase family protein [Fusibacter sp.]